MTNNQEYDAQLSDYRLEKSLVKRLLIAIDPLFFSNTESEQNVLRQKFYWSHEKQVNRFLYKELFDLNYQSSDNEEELSDGQIRLFNAYTTAVYGVGENSFRLNEFQPKDFDLTNYPTLYDYDLSVFEYQRQTFEKESPGSWKQNDYRLYLNHDWARILDSNGDFYYVTLMSLSRYLYDELENIESELIDQLIPHQLVDGPNHGKNSEGGMIWDMITDACGLEAQLEELESRSRKYRSKRVLMLDDEFHRSKEKAVYSIKYFDERHSPHWNIVVNNAATAKNIRFQHIVKDCQKYSQPVEQIEVLKSRESEKLTQFIREQYQDIMENFNPKVVKMKKKMQVVLSFQ